MNTIRKKCTYDSKCPELETVTRKRLYGKISTIREWITEILRLKFGDSRRKQEPLPNTKIAVKIGISRQTLIDYQKIAIAHKLANADNEKNLTIQIPDKTKTANEFLRYSMDDLMKDPLVADWVQDMMTRKSGSPIKIWRPLYRSLKNLCNTLKINPEQLINDHKTTELILKNFAKEVQANHYDREGLDSKVKIGALDTIMYRTVMATRDFCGFYHMTWQRGTSGIMSAKLIRHGNYADVRLSEEEFTKAEEYILENDGLDSDFFRIFFFGIDSCARKEAILTARVEYRSHISARTGKEILFMEVIETKTIHINKGKWTKYITNPKLIESIKLARKHGQEFLYNSDMSRNTAYKKFLKDLKKLFKFLGKEQTHDGFYIARPFHALRHIGGQRLLDKTDWNLGLVCKIGGWHTAKELEDSYGKMPPERVLDGVEKIQERIES